MVVRERERADGPKVINLSFAPVPHHVSDLREYTAGSTYFSHGVGSSNREPAAKTRASLLLAPERRSVAQRRTEGGFPNRLRDDDEREGARVDGDCRRSRCRWGRAGT